MMLADRDSSELVRARILPPLIICVIAYILLIGFHCHAVFETKHGIAKDAAPLQTRRATLVQTVHSHWAAGVGYALFTAIAVWFSSVRRHPRWATWLLLLFLLAPWLYYVCVCAALIGSVVT